MRHDVTELRVYQSEKAVPFLVDHPFAALLMDMGLGKTIAVLTALLALTAYLPAIVIAPLRVARGVWYQEARDWTHTAHLRVVRVLGNEAQRMRALLTPADVYVINVENTAWLFRKAIPELVKALGRWPFPWLILDECSKFKHAGTERFKAIRYNLDRFQRRTIMSGTPAPQGLMNLWSQYYIVDEGQRLGDSVDRYKFRFFAPVARLEIDGEAFKWEARAGAMEYISNLVRDVTLRLDAEDYLQLPPVLENRIEVELPPRVRALYDQFERDMWIQLDNAVEVAAMNPAVLTQKCHQLANGAVYNDPLLRTEYTVFHDEKIAALEEVLVSEESNVLLAYNFRHDLWRIQKLMREKFPDRRFEVFSGKESDKLQDEWNEGRIDVMGLNARSAAHGINIQYGGSAITQFSLTYVNEDYRQLIKRLQRSGQRDANVRLHRIMAKDTVDESIRISNNRHENTQRQFVDSLNLYRAMKELLS